MTASKFSVRFLSIAEEDLLEIIDYLAAQHPSAAIAVLDHLERQFKELTRNPWLGRVPADTNLARLDYRVLVVSDYLIFYKVRGKTVTIYRIMHGSHDIVPLLEEL